MNRRSFVSVLVSLLLAGFASRAVPAREKVQESHTPVQKPPEGPAEPVWPAQGFPGSDVY